MGRGRKPSMKTIMGTINRTESASPAPPVCVPKCPDVLQGEARKEWYRITKVLHGCGMTTALDVAPLAVYCAAWAAWCDAQADLAKNGYSVETPNGALQLSVMATVANRAAETMHKLLSEFGLSPAARSRMMLRKEKQADESNPWNGLLANAG